MEKFILYFLLIFFSVFMEKFIQKDLNSFFLLIIVFFYNCLLRSLSKPSITFVELCEICSIKVEMKIYCFLDLLFKSTSTKFTGSRYQACLYLLTQVILKFLLSG